MSNEKESRELPDMTGLQITPPLVNLASEVTVLLVKIISETLYKSNELEACKIAHRMETVSKQMKIALNPEGPYSFWSDLVMGVFGRFGDSSKYIKLIYPIAHPKYVFAEACRKVGRYMESDRLDSKYEDRRDIHVGSFVLAMFGRVVPDYYRVYDVLKRVEEREVELENKLLEDEDFAIEVFHRIKLIRREDKLYIFDKFFKGQLKKNIRLLVLFSKEPFRNFYNSLLEYEDSSNEETEMDEHETYNSGQDFPVLSSIGQIVLSNKECVVSLVATHGGMVFELLPKKGNLWTDEEVLKSMFLFPSKFKHRDEYLSEINPVRFVGSEARIHWEFAFGQGHRGTDLLGSSLSNHKSLEEKDNVVKMLVMRGPMDGTYPTWLPAQMAEETYNFTEFWSDFFKLLISYYKVSKEEIAMWVKALVSEVGVNATKQSSSRSDFWIQFIRKLSTLEEDVHWGSPTRCILGALVETKAGEQLKRKVKELHILLESDFQVDDGTTIFGDKSITEFYGISIGTHSDSD
jgi:hypothetical protein